MDPVAPPARRNDNRRERTARAIREAAAVLFHEQGVPRTTIDEIAAAAGVSVGSVYVHFGSKEALYLALVEQAVEAKARYLAQAEASASPLHRVFNAGDAYVRFALDNPMMFRLVAGRAHHPHASDELEAVEQRISDRLEGLVFGVTADLLAAMQAGEIEEVPAERAMVFLWGTWSGVIARSLRQDRLRVSREELQMTLTIARNVLTRGLGGEVPHLPLWDAAAPCVAP